MAKPFKAKGVKFFCGFIGNVVLPSLELVELFAKHNWHVCEPFSQHIDFEMVTDYYEHEMGKNLHRFWFPLEWRDERISAPELLVPLKYAVTEIEQQFVFNGMRTINLDPGYITEAKLVLATFKDYAHRVYIGESVYGDVQMQWRPSGYEFLPWTYGDYKTETAQAFFCDLRKKLRHAMKLAAMPASK